MAKTQTHGRGQRGTDWYAEPHQNLTVSLYIKPQELPVSRQFFLTIIGSLAIRDTLLHYTDHPVSIKWPNDIYMDNRKICGLLFENRIFGTNIAHAVLGVGLNVLQTVFPEKFQQKTISLKQLEPHRSFSFIEIIQHIQGYLSHYKKLLTDGHYDRLIELYNTYLFQKDELKSYKVGSRVFEGKIIRVEEDGLLQIEHEGKVTKYDLKDIVYQL